jgi:hypothetical protein
MNLRFTQWLEALVTPAVVQLNPSILEEAVVSIFSVGVHLLSVARI